MLLKEIIEEVRGNMDDVDQETWKDSELVGYVNEIIEDLCRRAEVITDSQTVAEVLASATVTLGAAGGSIASVTVNGVVITSGAVAFNTDLTTTAAALAANINAFTSTPDYTATASGAIVTIKAKPGTGANPNGYVVSVSISGMTATVTNMAGGTSLCEIYLLSGIGWYALDPRVIQVTRAKPALVTYPLSRKSKDWLDASWTNWEAATGDPKYFIPGADTGKIRIVPTPTKADKAALDVTRLPLSGLSHTNMNVTPEIPTVYHRKLFPGIKWKAYSKLRYGQMVDVGRARENEAAWTAAVKEIITEEGRRKAVFDTAAPLVREGGRQYGGTRGVNI